MNILPFKRWEYIKLIMYACFQLVHPSVLINVKLFWKGMMLQFDDASVDVLFCLFLLIGFQKSLFSQNIVFKAIQAAICVHSLAAFFRLFLIHVTFIYFLSISNYSRTRWRRWRFLFLRWELWLLEDWQMQAIWVNVMWSGRWGAKMCRNRKWEIVSL